MRKRYLSKLLAGALLVASVSSFVSCKDYDDDINNLQEQINKAALREEVTSQLTSLSNALSTAIDNVKGAADNAKTAADAALDAANAAQTTADGKVSKTDYEAAVASMKADAQKAGQELAAAITSVSTAAQNAKDSLAAEVDAAKKAANNAQKAADAVKERTDSLARAGLLTADQLARLNQDVKNAQAAADAAKDAAAKAEQNAKDYADGKAKETLEAADAAAKAAAKAAVDAYDIDAQAKIQKAIAEALKENNLQNIPADLKEQLEKLADLQKDLGKASELKETVDGLRKDLDKLNEETLPQLKQSVELYKTQIGELYQAVTSVNLYITQTANWKYLDDRNGHGTVHLHFAYAKEKTNKFPQNTAVADKQYIFTDGNIYTLDREVLIRVSPATANLTADMIALYNSVGDQLPSNLVQVKSIEPYDEIMTRSMSPSGIWKVTFSLIDYKDNKAAFEAATSKKNKDVVFAVGVNNTPSEAGIGRTVFSEYDVLVKASEAVHAYDFNVNDTDVKFIHNRWSTCEDQTILTNIPSDRSKHVVELNWKPSRPGYETPAVSANDNNSGDRVDCGFTNGYGYDPYYNWVPNENDNRQDCKILSVNAGEDIEIIYPEINAFKALRGFYVTLDEAFAKESNMSEITAWRAYEYENVGWTKLDGTVMPAHMFDGNKGTISIKWMSNPDIIGFRVYAVNLDGTLVDPDGRAFYVQVGAVVNTKAMGDANVTVSDKPGKSYVDVAVDGAKLFTDESDVYVPVWGDNNPLVLNGTALITPLDGESDRYETQTGTEVTGRDISDYVEFEFYDSENGKWLTLAQFNALTKTKRDKITNIRTFIRNPRYLLDGETYYVKLQGRSNTVSSGASSSSMIVDEIALKVKKVLPSDIPSELTVLSGLAATINPLKVYVKPRYMYFDSSWRPAERMGYWATAPYTNIWNVNNADVNNYWIYGADVRPYDLADIFNGLYDTSQTPPVVDNYGFEFALSVVDYAGNEVSTQSDYQSVKSYSSYGRYNLYDENSPMTTGSMGTYMVPYAVPYASKRYVDGKTNHDVYTTYTYKGISLTKTRTNANQVWQPSAISDANVTTRKLMTGFKVRYVSALNAAGFKLFVDDSELKKLIWQGYNVDLTVTTTNTAAKITAAKTASETAHKKFNYLVTYEDGGIVTLDSVAYTPYTIPGLTSATAATRMELPASATLAWMLNNNYLRITKASIDGDFLEVDAAAGDNTGASAYVTGAAKTVNFVSGSTVTSWTDTRAVNGIKLRRKYSTGGTTLTSDLRFKLTLTFEDVFGQESTKEIEVTMQHPKPL